VTREKDEGRVKLRLMDEDYHGGTMALIVGIRAFGTTGYAIDAYKYCSAVSYISEPFNINMQQLF
jgi:hypothetical protein